MSCEQHRACFTDLLEGALDREQRVLLERHLESCGECARELSALEATIGALRNLPPVAPPWALRRRVVDAFVAHHQGDVTGSETTRPSGAHTIRGPRGSRARAWALPAGVIALSFFLALTAGPGTELDRPGAPKLCLPIVMIAGLLPAITLLGWCLGRQKRAPASMFAFNAAAGALAGQIALFALCPILDSRTHALVLHTGSLTTVTLLGALLALAQRLRPAD